MITTVFYTPHTLSSPPLPSPASSFPSHPYHPSPSLSPISPLSFPLTPITPLTSHPSHPPLPQVFSSVHGDYFRALAGAKSVSKQIEYMKQFGTAAPVLSDVNSVLDRDLMVSSAPIEEVIEVFIVFVIY